MRTEPTTSVLTIACATLLLAACDEPTTSTVGRPEANSPLAAFHAEARHEARMAEADAILLTGEPFTVRAPLDPYFINQAPAFMIRSHARTDLVMQRLVSRPGVGAWHTHPGPSFGIVEQGQVMLTRRIKGGCTTEVYDRGDAYFEIANQVHRVTILGTVDAVEYKVRFNTPVGAAFSAPAREPDC